MKCPAFQFYPGDWLRSTDLRSCSVGARGLWADMLCLMHEGNPYGYLKVGDKVIHKDTLARMVGATVDDVAGWLDELGRAKVYSIDGGCIFSRRMVRDESIRIKRAAGGNLGGNPALRKDNLTPNLGITPASAVASASAIQKPLVAATTEFDVAWKKYPKRSGNNPRKDAEEAWNARAKSGVATADMLAGLDRYAKWCEATGKIGTEHVMRASTFFGPSKPFEQDFALPAPKPNGSGAPWWSSNEGIQAKAAEVGVESRTGESWNDLKARVNAALAAA